MDCNLTNNVIRLADFYKTILEIDNGSNDNVHQFIISEETTMTIYNDGKNRKSNYQNIQLAFTVNDIDTEFERLKKLGVEITEPPAVRPWGAKNMTFNDPDGNAVTFRCFLK